MVGKRTPNDASIDGTSFIDTLTVGQIGLFGTNNFIGQIDELRITKNTARYRSDASFALPTRAWPRPPSVTVPYNIGLPVISGGTTTGSTLSTTDGTWKSATTPTFTYIWRRDGNVIAGSSLNTHTVVSADHGTHLTSSVTATNPSGSTSALSADFVVP